MKNIKDSIVADRGSSINNAENSNNNFLKQVRKESAIISFVVGIIASLVASFIYDKFI